MICYLKDKIPVNRIMSEQRWLFLFSSKLFQAAASNNQRKCDFICLFPHDLKNLNHIFDDHVGSDMTKEEFRQLCKTAWEKQHGFVIIDLSSKKHNDKYGSGLDEFYIFKLNTRISLFSLYKMENLLKQIVNNTEPKRWFSVVVSDNKTRFKHGLSHQFNWIKRKITK